MPRLSRATARRIALGEAVQRLRKLYGRPAKPATSDPFELVLWENVAYLAPPARRRDAFDQLRRTVGTRPERILAAPQASLDRIASHGVLKDTFGARLRECARIAVERFGSDLDAAADLPLPAAKRALRAFPGIGEPGAEKILLFSGRHALLAPESNGLRVLARLGLVREEKSYARMYAASRTAAADLAPKAGVLLEAHLLLQHHGQTLCKRTAPLCPACPLEDRCAHAARAAGRRGIV